MPGRSDELDALSRRHGVTLPESLQDELLALIDSGVQPDLDDTVADEQAIGIDTWYAELPTQQVQAPLEPTERPGLLADRYEVLDLLGSGGMGEVHRVRDHVLQRIVAMKRATRAVSAALRSRFFQEAQATAQLDHPGVVPVYDYGELPDGALFYTMPVVRGHTLQEAITAVHEASDERRWGEAPDGTTFRRLVVSFLTVCEAMAYAHDRGVIHRDLKPENVMLGPYGQTLVVDWGLAKIVDGPTPTEERITDGSVHTHRSSSSNHTSVGTVTGTPLYMSPEQARGANDVLDQRTDVWSMGVMLYELMAGRPPFRAARKVEVIAKVIAGSPAPLLEVAGRPLPRELVELAERCLNKEPADRPPDAGVLADEVRAWLDGERRREQALALVDEADTLAPLVGTKRATAAQREVEAERLLTPMESWRPVDEKLPGWNLLAQAEALRTEADQLEQQRLDLFRQALALVPDLDVAHDGLAAWYRSRHREAERSGDSRRASELEALLRAHNTGLHDRYLEGLATVALQVDAAGATATIRPWVPFQRRLVAGEPVFSGELDGAVELPPGRYLVELDAPGRARVRYPIALGRGASWDRTPPGEDAPQPIHLPRVDDLGPQEVYVPAGWFGFGGDEEAHASPPRVRLWVDGFAMTRTPVTVGEYLAFLAHLKQTDQTEAFEAYRPAPEQLDLVEDGARLRPGRDAEGFEWTADLPMSYVSYPAAHAYAAWRAERDGLPWRLPTDVEWEKAARGTDGRKYPWGDWLDPTWCAIQGSQAGDPVPRPVASHPVDRSPYGVLDMAGGLIEWTTSPYQADGPQVEGGREVPPDATPSADGSIRRVGRGAAFYYVPMLARSCTRFSLSEPRSLVDHGVRLVRSLP